MAYISTRKILLYGHRYRQRFDNDKYANDRFRTPFERSLHRRC